MRQITTLKRACYDIFLFFVLTTQVLIRLNISLPVTFYHLALKLTLHMNKPTKLRQSERSQKFCQRKHFGWKTFYFVKTTRFDSRGSILTFFWTCKYNVRNFSKRISAWFRGKAVKEVWILTSSLTKENLKKRKGGFLYYLL